MCVSLLQNGLLMAKMHCLLKLHVIVMKSHRISSKLHCTSNFIIILHNCSILYVSTKTKSINSFVFVSSCVMSAVTSFSRAISPRSWSSVPSVLGIFKQLMHWHPSEQCINCSLQPHLLVVQPVTHLHSFKSKLTPSQIACIFRGVSHTTVSLLTLSTQPYSVIDWRTVLVLSACLHVSRTQHDLFLWW